MSYQEESLRQVVSLLQDSNKHRDELENQLLDYKKAYDDLRKEYQTLKVGIVCSDCQTRRLCEGDKHCSGCARLKVSLERQLFEAEETTRYWQRCYETLLEKWHEK